ncbi:MAG: signal recognition particle receptor subunit alpha [Ignavibacteriales bacterium]|nr:signal recognition particle receptor subunit alpha [Ignavibacteriales bacterium]
MNSTLSASPRFVKIRLPRAAFRPKSPDLTAGGLRLRWPEGHAPMFDQLSGRLEKMVKFLRGEVKVTDKALAEALKMMRLAFLEADVNYKVVKDFEARIRDKALGEEVLGGPQSGPAGHQDRPRRAGRDPRRGPEAAPVLEPAAVGLHAGRPPGERQDHDLRQAGPLRGAGSARPPVRLVRPEAAGRPGPASRRS